MQPILVSPCLHAYRACSHQNAQNSRCRVQLVTAVELCLTLLQSTLLQPTSYGCSFVGVPIGCNDRIMHLYLHKYRLVEIFQHAMIQESNAAAHQTV